MTPTVHEPVVKNPTEQVVKVGTKSKVEEKEIPFKVEYKEDKTISSIDLDTMWKLRVEGKKGKLITTTTYTLNTQTGEVTENTTTSTEKPVNEFRVIGIKPEVTTEVISVTTKYEEDKTKEARTIEVVNPGKEGKIVTTTNFRVEYSGDNNEFYSTIAEEPIVDKTEMIQKVVKVGTKPKVTTEVIPITTKEEKDDSKVVGTSKTINPGKEGKIVTTTPYILNEKDGTVKEGTPTVEKTEMIQKVVKVGTHPASEVPNEAPSVEIPEAIVSEKGEALVQPELPEYHISEKGESLVQPELPEFNGGVNPNEATSIDVPEYKIKTVKREDVTTLTPSYVRMANMKLNEGETQITHNGKNGSLTKVYEDIVGEDGKILKSTLLSENRVEPEIKVIRYGTKKPGENHGETGLYRLSEHTKDIDIVAFNQNIKLNGNEMKSLGQNELYKRSQTEIENNLFLAEKPGWYIIANAPLSEETLNKLNDGSYINHKNVGKEMLKLVNEERKRVGKKTLKWSNGLYELSKIRAKELGENGNIRYYNSNNEELKHSRDENGTKWFTVAKGSSFQGRVLGENLAGYTLPRNIYKVFSEKAIAEQLFNQWKASKGHYANMIDSDYTEFGFDFALSSFWRTNHTNIDYLAQGLQGVQLFAV